MKNEFWFEAIENAGKLIAIHFDVDGADSPACRQDAEIAEQLLDGIVGKERNPVVRPDAALRQERGETAAAFAQTSVIDDPVVIGGDHPRLARRAGRRSRNPALQKL